MLSVDCGPFANRPVIDTETVGHRRTPLYVTFEMPDNTQFERQ